MFPLSANIGIKSWSFRHITDIGDLARAVTTAACHQVDLSGCHVNYDDSAAQKATVDTLRDAGVSICGIGVVQLRDDLAYNRRFFDFARLAGCDVVAVNFVPTGHEAVLAQAERLAEEYGVRVAIHNHGCHHWLGNSEALTWVLKRCGQRIGLCIDTAWCIDSGEDPTAWLDAFGDRLYGVHFKDFTYDSRRKPVDCVVGAGLLDIKSFLKRFRQLPFTGSAVVEYEGPDAVLMSARCVDAVRVTWRESAS